MVAFDFPASPTNGQTYSLNGVVFTYNGYGWVQQGNSGGVNTAYVDSQDNLRVLKAGDTMTGPLTIVAPDAQMNWQRSGDSNVAQSYFNRASGATAWLWRWMDQGPTADLNVYRYDDAGVIQTPAALRLSRASGSMVLGANIASNSPTTGTLTVAGGVGIGGSINAGINLYVNGEPASATDIVMNTVRGGARNYGFRINQGVLGDFYFMQSSTVGGNPFAGYGVWGVENIGGPIAFGSQFNVIVRSGTQSTSPSTGALTVNGGVGVGGSLVVGGGASFAAVTVSSASHSRLAINSNVGLANVITGQKNGIGRWEMVLGNPGSETGGNAGSDFEFYGLNDAGGSIIPVFDVLRATGVIRLKSTMLSTTSTSGALTVAGGVGISGALNIGNDTSISTASGTTPALFMAPSNAGYAGRICRIITTRAGTNEFYYYTGESASGADTDFYVRGDGLVASDAGASMSTPADYADMMEWADGNSDDEDRRGLTVVMEGDKVRLSTMEDDPIDIVGAVSVNPTVCGRSAWNKWQGKYLRDDWDGPVLNKSGERTLNPDFREDEIYVPRIERKEWTPIGLVGILRIRKGQKTGDRWKKMRDVGDNVEEWLIR